jgi:anti-anti-sigma factor
MNEVVSRDASAPDALEIEFTRNGSGAVMSLHGELDLQSAPGLEERLSVVDGTAPGPLVVDLSGLTFMDSSGLRVIIRFDQAAQASGRQLSFRRGGDQVQKLFELTGVLERFSFED